MIIAIQPDDYTNPATGKADSSSPIWARHLQAAGHEVRWVHVYRADIIDQLRGCDGFMWRYEHTSRMRQVARRLLPVVEHELGMLVYPDSNTAWHYDDKIAQAYLLEALGIPTPRTWVWFDRQAAEAFASAADYPLVLKLWSGAGSSNVRLLRSAPEALRAIRSLFASGVFSLNDLQSGLVRGRIKPAAKGLVYGPVWTPHGNWDLHKGYVLLQEFLPGNAFDTRVTIIGNRAFAFRRLNRPGDFRASGSGRIDHDPAQIDPKFIRLALHTTCAVKAQSLAIDGLLRGNEPVVGEISYTYASWAIKACPGHWQLRGDPAAGELVWKEGPLAPEEAQIEDYMAALKERQNAKALI